jgi:hypothetical protein
VAVCIAAGTLKLVLATNAFTLAWTHSVEKTRWEEDYRVAGAALVLEAARIRGTGAGMEPPADAVLRDGVWHYRPNQAMPRLVLANSPFGGSYEICVYGKCQTLPTADGREPAVLEVCK